MGFEGNITNFPISEVIQIITLGKKTGLLSINGKTEDLCIYFNEGYAEYAHVSVDDISIGETLVKRGIIKQEQLEAALLKQRELAEKNDRLHIGTILYGMDLIPEDVIFYFIKLEIQDCLYRAISEETGIFRFDTEKRLTPDDIKVVVDVEDMILNGIDRIEQWITMKKAIGSNDSIYEARVNPDGKTDLTIDEWKVISLIDGNKTLNEILALARFDRFRTTEIIYGMLRKEVITHR